METSERLAAPDTADLVRSLRQSQARLQDLLELSSDWYWEQDENHRFSEIVGKMHGATRGMIGRSHWDPALRLEPVNQTWKQHRNNLAARLPFTELIVKAAAPTGFAFYAISGRPWYDENGRFCGYRGFTRDITRQRLADERIRYLTSHDELTGLPNRTTFCETLNLALKNARRLNHAFAVLFIDLDRFKIINDTLGHGAGDQLLREIGARLTHSLRTSDMVARLGGDEFAVLAQELATPEHAAAVARKILAALVQPIFVGGQECRVTASIGICMYPADGSDMQTLMRNADIAMYRAKDEGKNNFQFFSKDVKAPSLQRLALETGLRRALEQHEFQLHYQAKRDLRSGAITGVEALLRWNHPELGMVAPGQFIPLAEETGLIVPIGKWVLETACAQNMAWQRAGLPPVCMAVNLSARQFADPALLDDIAAALAASGMPAELLELELTENMVMQNHDRAGRLLNDIKRLGVRLAIDDFGVGHSSLAQLKRFPIDTLKVDRAFIRDLPGNAEDCAITQAIIAMAKTLHLTVVAEGVETREQEQFLSEHACDETQGYYFNKPCAPEQFAELLRRHSGTCASIPG